MCWQPVVWLHVSMVHGLLSSQLCGVPATHTPPWQTSVPLHRFRSGHGVPFGTTTLLQPLTASHMSAVQGLWSSHAERWTHPRVGPHASSVQLLESWQEIGAPPTHAPLRHASFTVHALPS